MSYNHIGTYGLIGDMHSAALVGMDGSIDWCCLPHFDSPSVFAKILDDKIGGFFRISAPVHERLTQMYLPETNVLVTRFLGREGVGEIIDFMPVRRKRSGGGEIIRIVHGVRGAIHFEAECRPAFGYALKSHEVELVGRSAVFSGSGCRMTVTSGQAWRLENNSAKTEFVLEPNQSATFILQYENGQGAELPADLRVYGQAALDETLAYWKDWVAKCTYSGRWREMVIRSALTLKLLTFAPTGAMVAAPTCSLPEEIGGVRNWDYRYTWIRDAAFMIYSLLRLGYTEEASAFMGWIEKRATEEDTDIGPIQLMYGIDGRSELDEVSLTHLDGYMGSRPVRIGNAASRQLQLDIYGELIDSIYLYNKYAEPISYDLWAYLRKMLDWVCNNWRRRDHGIWEVRAAPQHHVYSKVQCWVALDRGIRIASKRGLPLDVPRMRAEAGTIYEEVMRCGWNPFRKAFVQHFGSTAMDASALLMPLMMFVGPNDPRMVSTVDQIVHELVSDSLVYRYELGKASGDGLPGIEGTFSICTFWLVEVLARMGRIQEARLIFEKMLTYANHLGLYAEEIGPTGEALGNFPQAFTHLGLISAAYDLDRTLDQKRCRGPAMAPRA